MRESTDDRSPPGASGSTGPRQSNRWQVAPPPAPTAARWEVEVRAGVPPRRLRQHGETARGGAPTKPRKRGRSGSRPPTAFHTPGGDTASSLRGSPRAGEDRRLMPRLAILAILVNRAARNSHRNRRARLLAVAPDHVIVSTKPGRERARGASSRRARIARSGLDQVSVLSRSKESEGPMPTESTPELATQFVGAAHDGPNLVNAGGWRPRGRAVRSLWHAGDLDVVALSASPSDQILARKAPVF